MDPFSDSVRLTDYRDSSTRRKRDRDHRDSLEMMSDSELTNMRGKGSAENVTVFSDTCDDNLPSSRHRLAASRRLIDSLQKRRSNKETTPLLDDRNGRVPEKERSIVKMDSYEAQVLAPPPSSKKRSSTKWERLKQW